VRVCHTLLTVLPLQAAVPLVWTTNWRLGTKVPQMFERPGIIIGDSTRASA
jgi:hypothetical protein